LVEALEDPSNTYRGQSLWVRRHYVEALGQIGSKNALGGLIRALRDEDPAVRSAALEAVERIAGRSYAEGRSRPEQVEAWERWWANQQPHR
jgi:HEAT repeat protein